MYIISVILTKLLKIKGITYRHQEIDEVFKILELSRYQSVFYLTPYFKIC